MNDLFKNFGNGEVHSEVQVFNFNDNKVRTVKIHDEPWFLTKDVCVVLGISNSRDAISALDEDEKGVVITDTLGGEQKTSIVSESGLYSLILRSRKPEAKAFKKWVTSEVLPAIRKTGAYVHATPEMTNEELIARALIAAKEAIDRKDAQLKVQAEQLELQAPAVEYVRNVLDSRSLHTINSIAVYLEISAVALNRFLVDQGIIYRQGKIFCPTAKIRDKGYCDYAIIPYLNSKGEKMTCSHLKWTEKGRRFIVELYKKVKGFRKKSETIA